MKRNILFLPFAILFAVIACEESVPLGPGADCPSGVCEPRAPSFVAPDAEVAATAAGLISYCPSNKCPTGYTACPDSRFPCDVNLLTDRNNCGECGVVCPTTESEQFECVDGRCVMSCSDMALDCDGLPDNGCETPRTSNNHCGSCDVACLDPDMPCIRRDDKTFGCGCGGNRLYCANRCIDPDTNDAHCGQCGNRCDTNIPIDPSLNMYYGCYDGQCEQLKCLPDFADCDGDPSNGCESSTITNQNCQSCGNVCPAGQDCRGTNLGGFHYECMCNPGTTFCPYIGYNPTLSGECVDFASDVWNCGGCAIECDNSRFESCVNGSCKQICMFGMADCNGNQSDFCEVNTARDPRNCGGCGIVCDAVAGQACVGGRCVVEPCPTEDAGSGPQ